MKLSPKALRVQNGLKQESVAKHLNLSLSAYQRRENGKVKWYADELYSLSKLYRVSMDIFLTKKCHVKTQQRESG